VLVTALRAMQLLTCDPEGRLAPTPLAAEHLQSGQPFDVSAYLGLAADAPAVLQLVDQLRTSRPRGSDACEPGQGTAYIAREGARSLMDEAASARRLTMALAGRARNCAPALAERVELPRSRSLLDVGGGSGLYSIALLQKFPDLRAAVFDRGPVLPAAREFAEEFGVSDRLQTVAGDMFLDPWPACDVVLLSNVLHDWDEPECLQLLARVREMLPRGGRLLIHDVLLNDALDGPLPVALYSARLFQLTEGRAYSRGEFVRMLERTGFQLESTRPTLVHCQVLAARPR
jgi:SAM-dependent methyltransferase